jgi:hypothetical protein
MYKALKIADIARLVDKKKDKKAISRGVAHYHASRGVYAEVILPFEPTHKAQRKTVKRHLFGVNILEKTEKGGYSKIDSITLVPCTSGGEVILNYWGKTYTYKLPSGYKFLEI